MSAPEPVPVSASASTSPSPIPHIEHFLALRGNVTTNPIPNQTPTPTAATTPSLATPTPSSHSSSKPWLAGVIVGAVVAVVAVAALAFWLTFRRRRRQRYEQARQNDPQLTPDQFRRRSHMSQQALALEAERERRAIIRKSLISRSSGSLSYMDGAPPATAAAPEMENVGYRGVPLGHQRQPVVKPSQPGGEPPQPSVRDYDIPEGFYPEQINTAAAAVIPPSAVGLRDDYKEWESSIRRHTSRIAERHPSLAEVPELEDQEEQAQRQPLVVRNNVDVENSPPIPPRSRLRPLSTADLPSQAVGFLPHQMHSNPFTMQNELATSPTSLYSVDFQHPPSAGGGRCSVTSILHTRDEVQKCLTNIEWAGGKGELLALNLLSEKTDADDKPLTAETKHSIVLVLDTLDAKTAKARATGRVNKKKAKQTKKQQQRQQRLSVARKPLRELHNKAVLQSTLAGAVIKSTSLHTKASSPSHTSVAMDAAAAARDAYKENLDNIILCPDCKEFPPNLVEEFSSGDMVCDSCGLVVGPRIIDSRSEWRTFANDDQGNDDPSRVGETANSLANDEGLRTQVDMRAANGKLAGKLNSINKKSQSEKLNNDLQEGFRAISGLVDIMQTSNIVGQTAMHIYKLAYEHGQLKGKPRDAVIAGCIFIACRQCGVPRTFREIYAITHVSKKEIGRVFKSLESFLSKIQEKNPQASAAQGVKDYKASSSTTAEELCTRYCSLLGFRNTPRMEKISKALARKTTGIPDLAGRSPLSVAAACIYFASQYLDDPRASKDIAAVAGVSDGTIKTAYRFLYNTRETLVESDWNGNLENLSSS
ncbi:transcription initiation factor IIB [Sporothrix eucalyptigena]